MMVTKVVVPQLGEGVEEVTILQWLVNEGDSVEEYDGLVEVETDKVVTEIPSPTTATVLKIEISEQGSTAPVGATLAWLGEPDEAVPDSDSDGGEIEPVSQATANGEQGGEKEPGEKITPETDRLISERTAESALTPLVGRDSNLGFISPIVARIAAENKIDLNQVKGTGLNGRITKSDILAYLESPPQTTPPVKTTAPALTTERDLLPGTILPLTTIRRRIAEHMVESKRTSAHVTTLMEADMSGVVAHRSANKEAFSRGGARLTFTAYFVDAAIKALKSFPLVNSSWSGEGILIHKAINIGMATDLGEDGLIVPVIKHADELSLLGIARTVNDLANRARGKKLTPGDVQGATFSITNHGVSGSLLATPIINQPQSSILGVGAIQKRVKVISDEFGGDNIAIRPMVYLTLTFDHRILDGAGADHFLAKVVDTLESWPVG